MPYPKYPLLDKKRVKTISFGDRQSLVNVKDFGMPIIPGAGFGEFLKGIPDILAAKDLKEFASCLQQARKADKPIVWGMGGHVVKVGLNRLLIDLMERGWISAIAINGAFMIHDFEIGMAGRTSEDVAAGLQAGNYGNTQETGLFISMALKDGMRDGVGAGEAVGYYLKEAKFKYQRESVLYHAYTMNIPVTVHPTIGADFTHSHPMFSGEVAGALAERDFLQFASIVSRMGNGGVYLNIGSAVTLPEIFLKAVSFCLNQGLTLKNFHTAVFDFIRQYRPDENVRRRPVTGDGKGFYFIGHHEIMIPLLAALILNMN